MGRAGTTVRSAEMQSAKEPYKAKLGPKELDPLSTLNSRICSFVLSFIHQIFGHFFFLVSGIELALGNIIPIAYVFK